MKWLWLLSLLFLCSCQNNKVAYEEGIEYKVYAYNLDSQVIEEVYVSYLIDSPKAIFLLYTHYQNYLPIGYGSNVTPALGLIDCKVENKVIYYQVDEYIKIVDLKKFQKLLKETSSIYGYVDVHILYNQQIVC